MIASLLQRERFAAINAALGQDAQYRRQIVVGRVADFHVSHLCIV